MKLSSIYRNTIAGFVLLNIVGGCGLAASDAERISRAEEQMQAGKYRAAMIELKNVLASDQNNATARLLLAQVSMGLGDIAAAEKELQRASELEAPDSVILAMQLDILLARRNYSEILVLLGTNVSGLTQQQLWSYRGEALVGLGNSGAAKETYMEWLTASAGSSDAELGVATTELMDGDSVAAIERLTRITESDPENYRAWQLLGSANLRSGNFDGAEDAFIKASETIKPQSDVWRYADILLGLTDSRLALGKTEEAHRSLERLTGVAPQAPATLFLAARLARSERDYAAASRHLQNLLNVMPDNSQAQLFLANMQMMQGNFAQSERLLHRVVATSPDNIQARKLLARVQLQQSQPTGAVEALAPVLEDLENDPDIFALLAEASLQQGNSEAAIRQLRKVADLSPGDMEAKLNLAAAYLSVEQTSLAIDILESVPEGAGILHRRERLLLKTLTAIGRQNDADVIAQNLLTNNADDERATVIVAEFYVKTQRSVQASEVLQAVVQQSPVAINARNLLGRIETIAGNLDIAHELFTEVIERDASNLAALIGLARIAEQAGDDTEVVRLLQDAATAHNEALGPRVLLIGKYYSQGNPEDAERMANEIVSIGFQSPGISEIVASVFAEAGRPDDALFQFRQAARLNPNSATVQLGLARAYLTLNNSVEARESLARALEINPGWPKAMTLLVLVELRQGQHNDAYELVSEFRSLHPDNLAAMILEGEVHAARQELLLAAEAFGRAVANGAGRPSVLRHYQMLDESDESQPESPLEEWLEKSPEDTVVRKILAQHHHMNGRGSNSIDEYTAVLQYAPDDADVLNNLAWLYQQNGDMQKALEFAEMALERNPESGSIIDTLAWIYRDLGQLDKSIELLGDASRLAPDNGEILYHYAVVLSDSGEKAKAKEILQALKSSDVVFPSQSQAEILLGEM